MRTINLCSYVNEKDLAEKERWLMQERVAGMIRIRIFENLVGLEFGSCRGSLWLGQDTLCIMARGRAERWGTVEYRLVDSDSKHSYWLYFLHGIRASVIINWEWRWTVKRGIRVARSFEEKRENAMCVLESGRVITPWKCSRLAHQTTRSSHLRFVVMNLKWDVDSILLCTQFFLHRFNTILCRPTIVSVC